MCARQEDLNRTSKQKQKRPLSIIEEHDSDDALAPDLFRIKDTQDGSSKENTPLAEDAPNSITTQADDKISSRSSTKPPESSRSKSSSISKNKSAVKSLSTSATKSLPELTLKSTNGIPALANSKAGSLTSASPSHDSKTPVLKGNNGRRQALTPTNNDNYNDNHSDGIIEESKSSHSDNSQSTCHDKHRSSDPRMIPRETFPRSSSDVSNEANLTNTITLHRPSVNGQSLARIRETAERLNLTSSSASSPSSLSSLSLSPKFQHRMRIQTSTSRTYLEGKSLQGTGMPQITITFSGSGATRVAPTSHTFFQDPDCISNNISNGVSCHLHSSDTSVGSTLNHKNSSRSSKSPKLSSFFSRRLSTESTGSLSDNELSDGSSGVLDSPEDIYLSDFRRLQETADKLRLSIRRPSTMLWKQQFMENFEFPKIRANANGGDAPDDERWTSDRKQRIDEALEWLRNELQEMRSQDQNLARQLLTIRNDIHQLKLRRSTEEHQELIDDFQSELEELQEFSDVLDLPQPVYGDNPLKHIGVTRLNISARRFSAC